MQPPRPALPEFDGIRPQNEPAPMRRPGNCRGRQIVWLDCRLATFQFRPTAFDDLALLGCPSTQLAFQGPGSEVFVGLRRCGQFDLALDTDLPL